MNEGKRNGKLFRYYKKLSAPNEWNRENIISNQYGNMPTSIILLQEFPFQYHNFRSRKFLIS